MVLALLVVSVMLMVRALLRVPLVLVAMAPLVLLVMLMVRVVVRLVMARVPMADVSGGGVAGGVNGEAAVPVRWQCNVIGMWHIMVVRVL